MVLHKLVFRRFRQNQTLRIFITKQERFLKLILPTSFFDIGTTNFGAGAESSKFLFLLFEVENVLKMFLNLLKAERIYKVSYLDNTSDFVSPEMMTWMRCAGKLFWAVGAVINMNC